VALLAAAALGGCATPPASTSTDTPTAATAPAAGPAWTTGRLLLRIDAGDDQPAQMHSALFELSGSAERGELRLSSPLGPQLLQARWAPGQAQLTTPEGTRGFASLDDLAAQALGEPLPLAALPDWLAGRAWPGAASQPLAPSADGFLQMGWAVDLSRHAQGLVEARRDGPPAVLLRLRLDTAVR
jgi:outer membrane lipoprotein LolB